jgi:hypothetical protein
MGERVVFFGQSPKKTTFPFFASEASKKGLIAEIVVRSVAKNKDSNNNDNERIFT